MFGIIIIFIYTILVFIYFAWSNANNVLNASKWLISAFLFLLVTYLFSGIEYYDGVSYLAMVFMFTSIVALLIGEFIGFRTIKKNQHHTMSSSFAASQKLAYKIKIIGLLCVIGTCIYLFDTIRNHGFVFGMRIGSEKMSVLGQISLIFLCMSLYVWLYSLLHAIKTRKFPSSIGLLCFFSYISKDIVMGNRGHTITIFVSTLVLLLYAVKSTKLNIYANIGRLIVLTVVFLSLIFGYMYSVTMTRNVFNPGIEVVFSTQSDFGARMADETIHAIETLDPFHKIISDILFYYSHQFTHYSIIFENYDYPPTMGVSTFHYITRRFEELLGPIYSNILTHSEKAFSMANISSHSWGTYHKSLLVDYGMIGATAASLILGFMMGLSRKKFINNPSDKNVILQVLICGGAILSIQTTPFTEVSWVYPLILALLLNIRLSSGHFAIQRDLKIERKSY